MNWDCPHKLPWEATASAVSVTWIGRQLATSTRPKYGKDVDTRTGDTTQNLPGHFGCYQDVSPVKTT